MNTYFDITASPVDSTGPEKVKNPLTNDDEDEDDGGHSCSDVEHGFDMARQLSHIVHVGHKHGWNQEPNGNAHLYVNKNN